MPDGRDRGPMERETPIRFDEIAHPDYFELRSTAAYAPDVPVRVAAEGFKRAAAAGQLNLLLDIRGVTGREPTMSERYDHAVQFTTLQAQTQPRIRVAVLGSLPIVHWQRFGEIVATNRGALIRVFIDEAEALEWLLQIPKSP